MRLVATPALRFPIEERHKIGGAIVGTSHDSRKSVTSLWVGNGIRGAVF